MQQAFLEISSICISCDNCRIICPENSISTNGLTYLVDTWSCTLCGLCQEICPVDCIKYVIPQDN